MSVRIIHGDCREVLPTLAADSFDCCVTSPPYYGLRDYQVDGQIGLEPTLALYLETMVDVFREVRRVLKPTGTCWLNIGDGYASSPPGNKTLGVSAKSGLNGVNGASGKYRETLANGHATKRDTIKSSSLKPKDLMMVPNRLALLLQEDGWYIRSEIIWQKPSPMPESVRDRPTCAHEKVWLLTKSPMYFYDAAAIAEPSCSDGRPQRARATQLAKDAGLTDAHIAALKACGVSDAGKAQATQSGFERNTVEVMRLAAEAKAALGGYTREFLIAETVNSRNVWSITSEPYRGAHYAVMPSALAERCIKAGSSERGCCPQCGKPWERVVERTDTIDLSAKGSRFDKGKTGGRDGGDRTQGGERFVRRYNGDWQQTCSCAAHEPEPCTVLDPFFGAGTTGLVADRLGRHCTGIELNPTNVEMGKDRVTADGPLFAEVTS